MARPDSYSNSPREVRDTARQLIESFGHDLSMLEGAMVAAMNRSILAAVEEERAGIVAQCEEIRDTHKKDAGMSAGAHSCVLAIRNRSQP